MRTYLKEPEETLPPRQTLDSSSRGFGGVREPSRNDVKDIFFALKKYLGSRHMSLAFRTSYHGNSRLHVTGYLWNLPESSEVVDEQ